MTFNKDTEAVHRIVDIINTFDQRAKNDHHKVASHLAEVVAALGADGCSPRLHLIAKELLRAVVREIEIPIRIELAIKLSNEAAVSTELVKILANDKIEVAWHVLQASLSLSDEDLMDVAVSQTPQHRLAIAKRKVVSAMVCSSLVCFGEKEVIEGILRNPGAELSERAYEQICAVAKEYLDLQELLVHRGDIPLLLAFSMLEWVAEALHVFLYNRIGIVPKALRLILAEATSALAVKMTLQQEIPTLIQKMVSQDGRWLANEVVTVMKGLPLDRIDLKIALASDYIGEALENMRMIVIKNKGKQFSTLCKAAEVPSEAFEAMLEHLFMYRKGYDGYPLNGPEFVLLAHREFTSKTPRQARAEIAALARQ